MTRSDLPAGPVRGDSPGVAAIDYNGDRYCIDCAKDVLDGEDLSIERSDGEKDSLSNADGEAVVDELVAGNIHTLGNGGVVLRNSADGSDLEHCGRHRHCKHAIPGDEHDYHDEPIGVRLDV